MCRALSASTAPSAAPTLPSVASTSACPLRPALTRIVRARPRGSAIVVSSVHASSSRTCGGSVATPWEPSVRRRSTGSPPAPFSSSSTDHSFAIIFVERIRA